MPILATAVTTIECDGTNGSSCPNDAVVEFTHPQGVAIRLAKNTGWTIWIETMCPECSKVPAVVAGTAPAAPAMAAVGLFQPVSEPSYWNNDMTGQMPLVPVLA